MASAREERLVENEELFRRANEEGNRFLIVSKEDVA